MPRGSPWMAGKGIAGKTGVADQFMRVVLETEGDQPRLSITAQPREP